MSAIKATVRAAAQAGEHAAMVEYEALTPETARSFLASGRDVVPDYAREAGEVIASAALRLEPRDVRDTRFAERVTDAWAQAFRAAWPAGDVEALAGQES